MTGVRRCGCFIAPTERCSSVSLRIVGDCSYCNVSFCGRHRLPEGESFSSGPLSSCIS